MVLKIAVVDDDPLFLKNIKKIAFDYLTSKKIVAIIDEYSNHRLLMYEINEGTYYDLLLLDIQMDNNDIDGITLSQNLRSINSNTLVIFVTSYMKYAIDAFKVKAFRYIPKTEMKVQLPSALEAAINEFEQRKNSFYSIETITKYIKLYCSDIYYIFKNGKYSIIVSSCGEYKVRKSLNEVYNELNSMEFIFVERGYIVNITHVDRMEDGKVFLDNDSVLQVSRNHAHLVKEKIAEYWSEHI